MQPLSELDEIRLARAATESGERRRGRLALGDECRGPGGRGAVRVVHVERLRKVVSEAAQALARERVAALERRYEEKLAALRTELESEAAAAALLAERVRSLERELAEARRRPRPRDPERRRRALRRLRATLRRLLVASASARPAAPAAPAAPRPHAPPEARPPEWVERLCARVAAAAARGAAEGVCAAGGRFGEAHAALEQRLARLERSVAPGAPAAAAPPVQQEKAPRPVDARRTALLRNLAKANVDLRRELGIVPRGGR
ncbi:MAG: hypothetical protein D6776_01855 [Planctomycetota bacterium]|nr:MAG: hypothetical protein D6776_01855 [Planctomycetota bacterium]